MSCALARGARLSVSATEIEASGAGGRGEARGCRLRGTGGSGGSSCCPLLGRRVVVDAALIDARVGGCLPAAGGFERAPCDVLDSYLGAAEIGHGPVVHDVGRACGEGSRSQHANDDESTHGAHARSIAHFRPTTRDAPPHRGGRRGRAQRPYLDFA